MKNFLYGILAMLFIIGAAYMAYQYGLHNSQNTLPVSTVSPTVLSTPAQELPTLVVTVTVAPASFNLEEENKILTQTLFKLHPDWNESQTTVTIISNDGKYAKGSAGGTGGGGLFFAAKVNGVWQIVAEGNGDIFCESLKNYPDFPNSLIPQCYDQTTGKYITR